MAMKAALLQLLLHGLTSEAHPICFEMGKRGKLGYVVTPYYAEHTSYVKVDAQALTKCGMTAEGMLDCWEQSDRTWRRLPERVTDFSMSTNAVCAALAQGGVRCYSHTLASMVGSYFNETNVTGVAAVSMKKSNLQVCAFDEAGTVQCATDLAMPSGLTGVVKIVGNGHFFCAMQAAPGRVDCWYHDEDPYNGYYGGVPEENRSIPEGLGLVYDIDAAGWGGGLCVVNSLKKVECFNHFGGAEKGFIPDYVDNSGAPYTAVAMGSRSVCALREQQDGQAVVCWGELSDIPRDLDTRWDRGTAWVTALGMGANIACLEISDRTTTETSSSSSTSSTSATSSTTTETTTLESVSSTSPTFSTPSTVTETMQPTSSTLPSAALTSAALASATSAGSVASATATATETTAHASLPTAAQTTAQASLPTAALAASTAPTSTALSTMLTSAALGSVPSASAPATKTTAKVSTTLSSMVPASTTLGSATKATARASTTDAATPSTSASSVSLAPTTSAKPTGVPSAPAPSPESSTLISITMGIEGLLCAELLSNHPLSEAVILGVKAGILAALGSSGLKEEDIETRLKCALSGARRMQASSGVEVQSSINSSGTGLPPAQFLGTVKEANTSLRALVQERVRRVPGIKEVVRPGATLLVLAGEPARLLFCEKGTCVGVEDSNGAEKDSGDDSGDNNGADSGAAACRPWALAALGLLRCFL